MLQQIRAFVQTIGIDHAVGELLEALMKDALAVVSRNDARIKGDVVESADRVRRNALRRGFFLDAGDKSFESCRVAAGGGRSGEGAWAKCRQTKSRDEKAHHRSHAVSSV
ncbi:hypothetical protein MPC4_10503 [Methylocella tundrae]|uniref:Uncharacterized protein n=1 Tax=Methylocella tundrae TaxID=227605 RepID=A0A8B6M0H6_METTU|nr:hypothetical protein MPC4_10503 [Methylocella tundrae]